MATKRIPIKIPKNKVCVVKIPGCSELRIYPGRENGEFRPQIEADESTVVTYENLTDTPEVG